MTCSCQSPEQVRAKERLLASIFDNVVSEPLPSPHILVETDENGITVVQLHAPSVNLLSVPFLRKLNDWLIWLYHDPETRAVILTSAIPNIFTDGLDVTELAGCTFEQFRLLWSAIQRLWLILNGFCKPTAVVITGTAPGVGCMSAMACDVRVMVRRACDADGAPLPGAKPFRIGLDQCGCGMFVPSYLQDMFEHLVGAREAELMTLSAVMLSPDDAAAVRLVDSVVDSKADGLAEARGFLFNMLRVFPLSFRTQKVILRRRFVDSLLTPEEQLYDAENMYETVSDERLQTSLSEYMMNLQAAKSQRA